MQSERTTFEALNSALRFAASRSAITSAEELAIMAAWNARASDAEITRLTEALRAAEERERDAVMSAYCTGATDVHNSWVEGTNGGEADFGEAASDYYSSIKGN